MHRDLKPSNVLVDNDGHLKVADFGLARCLPEDWRRHKDYWGVQGLGSGRQAEETTACWDLHAQRQHLTPEVITLWYRPLELLLGSRHYTTAVDMWSVGCIIAEMFLSRPLFYVKGADGVPDQILGILKLCGSPDAELPLDRFPGWVEPTKHYTRRLKEYLLDNGVPSGAADLLEQLLALNPEQRPTAEECLRHEWIRGTPE